MLKDGPQQYADEFNVWVLLLYAAARRARARVDANEVDRKRKYTQYLITSRAIETIR